MNIRFFSIMPLLLALILTTPCAGLAAQQLLDGVAAVVGEEVILVSEVEAYMLSRLNEAGTRPDSATLPLIRKQCLEDLINGKILVAHAKKDTTIIIKNEDVEQALNEHINRIIAENNLTIEDFEKELAKQGMNLYKFKAQLRKALREQLIKQRIQQSYLSAMSINKNDVLKFYAEYQDSLPKLGESVRLLKLSIAVSATDSSRQSAFSKISSIKTQLSNGESFFALAKKYSEEPNAATGGDLGFIGKGTLNELAFEEKAFSLEPGQISEPFETRLGFHILMVKEKKDQKVHLYQILVMVQPTEHAIQTIRSRLDSISSSGCSPALFVTAIKKYSTDPQLVSRGGDIGWYTTASLPSKFAESFDTLATSQVSSIITEGNVYSILMIQQKVSDRELSIDDDWEILSEKTKEIQAQKKLISLVKKWRQEIFIDVRL